MESEELMFDLVHFFLNVFFSHTNGDTHMYVEAEVLFRIKVTIRVCVKESVRKAQGQVHPFALAEFVSESNVPPYIPIVHPGFGMYLVLQF